MSIAAINEQLLRAIGAGVALLDRADLTIEFANGVFREWFEGATAGVQLATVMPDIEHGAVLTALNDERRYATEVSFRRKRRTLIVALTFTLTDSGVVLLECQNITRMRELESMIDSYSAMVERNTRDLQREKERVEKLLLSIMPRSVYEEYRTFGTVTPQSYGPVTVLTLDFAGFEAISEELGPAVIVSEMNDIYAAFDRIGEQFACERIKTMGDSYIAVAGLPDPDPNHAEAVANAAVRFLRYLAKRNETHPHPWTCRIGIASGSVIGSVVGTQRYVYDVFGRAVNLAARVREKAQAMEVLFDSSTRDLLRDRMSFVSAGEHELDGFGSRSVSRLAEASASRPNEILPT